jgi:hypothetical protein
VSGLGIKRYGISNDIDGLRVYQEIPFNGHTKTLKPDSLYELAI